MYEEVLNVDIVHCRGFWLPYKKYCGFWLPYRNYRGFWLPYRNYRGGQIPCKNYCALPWSLVTVQTLPWWPVTVRKLLRITAVAGYRGKRYRDEKPLPREALEINFDKSHKLLQSGNSDFSLNTDLLCQELG